jgi:hypothetical protein
MAAGEGVFGTLSGLAASWFLSPAVKEADADPMEIKATLRECGTAIAALTRFGKKLIARPEREPPLFTALS